MSRVFLNYDQKELDAQLNLRARWPEHAEFLTAWARNSKQTRAELSAQLDISYGDTAGQHLDLFPISDPAPGSEAKPGSEAEPVPLVAFIHGGYWQSLDKSDFSYLAPSFLSAGIAFASLNYDLAPSASVEDMVGQVRLALAWLYDHGAEYGIDPKRIFIAGHSAGGHLAAMVMATDWPELAAHLPSDLIKGGCSVSGVYELDPIRLSYQQPVVQLDPEMAQRLSPTFCTIRQKSPLICAVGAEETAEFLRQQDAFVAAWTDQGLAIQVVDLPGCHHFSAIDALGVPEHPLFKAFSQLVLGDA